MTLIQLNYLVAIVENGFNISRAAQALHTSQPGISRQIKLLEEQLGVTILYRSGGRIISLTEDGERIMISAKRIVSEAANLQQIGGEFLHQATGRLRVATLHSLALSLLPTAVAGVRQRYPGVTIDVQNGSADACFSLLRGGDIDLGITMEVPEPSYRLVHLPIKIIPRVLLAPRNHPLLDLETVQLDDIVRYPLIFQDALASTGWSVSRVFRARGIEYEPAIRAMDATIIKAYVEHGVGVAIVSAAAYDADRDRDVRAIDVSDIFEPGQVSAVFDPFRYVRGYVYDFIGFLAPEWTKKRVDEAIRSAVNATQVSPAVADDR